MRTRREPRTARLPSVAEVFGAPERAVLAALDATLQIATRSLRAEYPGLDRQGRIVADPDWEPYVPPQVPLIEQIVGAANHLHRLLAEYRAALDLALAGDRAGAGRDDGPRAGNPDEDDPLF